VSILAWRTSALIAVLLALGGSFLLWLRSQRFDLVVNQVRIAEGVPAEGLGPAVQAWAQGEMDREVVLAHEGQRWRFSRGELGLFFPLPDAAQQIDAAVAAERRLLAFLAPIPVSIQLPDKWDLERLEAALAPIRQVVERPPVDAVLQAQGETVQIEPSVDGTAVETVAVVRLLREATDQEMLALPVAPVRPEVTTESLEAMGIRRKVAEWTTHYDPDIPRAENVERAAQAFHGLVLRPGEILSYNATVGPINEETGWREAFVIVDGQLVPGIGGGVCQVATTLYGAAIRANLEIMERHPHQLAVSYIPPSEDAAVAQGWQDLKLRNTTAGHLLIHAESGGGSVTFRLYGDLPEGQAVEIESRVTGTLPIPTRFVDDPSLPPGAQVQVSAGSPGLRSEAYRLLYHNGELVKRELLSHDQYLATAAVVRRAPETAPETEQAIFGAKE